LKIDNEILMKELKRLEELARGGTNFTYGAMYHNLAALIKARTGVDPRPQS
jgi:predicted Ser/Thr protein kinase